MYLDSDEARALAVSVGEHSVMYFGRENLENLVVHLDAATGEVKILVATVEESKQKRSELYSQFLDEIVPLYADELDLSLQFYRSDAPIFDESRQARREYLKSYAMV